jgi:hypothetical protein
MMMMNEEKIQRFARAWIPGHCMIVSADNVDSNLRTLFLLCGHDTMRQYKHDLSNIKGWKKERLREITFDDKDAKDAIKDTARGYYDALVNSRYRDELIKLDIELASI